MARAAKAQTIWSGRDPRWLAAGAAACVLAMGAAAQAQPGAPFGASPPVQASPASAALQSVNLRAEQVALLQRTLSQADTHGFDHGAFTTPGLDVQLQSRDPQTRRAGQGLLMAQVLRYARAVHAGRLAPDAFLYEWGLKPAAYDPAPDFVQAVAQDRLGSWLDSLPPPYTGYDVLRHGLVVYRGIATRGGWAILAVTPDLKLGATGRQVADLRARLAIEDPAVNAAGGAVYDQALADAVSRAQKRFGLEPTGALDKSTIAALNVPVDQRVDQIIANMERWRWLPAELPSDRIQVNIAAAVLTVFHDDTPVLSMRAATGRPGDETPMLQSMIQSIVLNPPWNVPADIASKELWPKEHAHPGYFARNDFIVIHTPDGGTRVQQKAGPKAALGHVKFDFANKYGVYLHDTPNHGAFGRYARLVSHGCVRLEKPVALANTVMQDSAQWTPAVIDSTIAGGDTVRAPLPKPIAVFLLYWTAYVGPDGQVNFRGDPYGWDHVLMQRIDALGHGAA
jgi:murein L,D-transpeptidase YcbB/YkuD